MSLMNPAPLSTEFLSMVIIVHYRQSFIQTVEMHSLLGENYLPDILF